MQPKRLTASLSVAAQISESDMATLAELGFRSVINNRPDGEEPHQPSNETLEGAAHRWGLAYRHIPVTSGHFEQHHIDEFHAALSSLPGPTLAFCRTGTRSTSLWALVSARTMGVDAVQHIAADAGYDLTALRSRMSALTLDSPANRRAENSSTSAQVLIVGGGSAGCAVASSLLARDPSLKITIIEPSEHHYYQPAWTLVGGGVFDIEKTRVPTSQVIPQGVTWERGTVDVLLPDTNRVQLSDGREIGYEYLIVAPGLALRWDRIEGLSEALGRHGVTSNYRYDLAPYTWKLVRELKRGRVLFTQPGMPIKCAGAPQKAMYLSCDHWHREGLTDQIDVQFHNAGAVLFGVKEFVPPLMEYVERYRANLCFNSNLVAVDGPAGKATFEDKLADGTVTRRVVDFDMLHAVPPQAPHDFVSNSPLSDASGWLAVDPQTLRHPTYENVFSLGDTCSAPNAKTVAAVRKQAPVVAENLLSVMHHRSRHAVYDGYGACPLTVERGRVILAEFGYGGALMPTFPLDPTKPSRLAWLLKAKVLPPVYFHMVLRGREALAKPSMVDGPV